MTMHLKRTWVDSGIVARAHGPDGEAPDAAKRAKLSPREIFDILLYAKQTSFGEAQFMVFCRVLRKLVHGVPDDTRLGGPQHKLWNRAVAMHGSRQPKVMHACAHDYIMSPTCLPGIGIPRPAEASASWYQGNITRRRVPRPTRAPGHPVLRCHPVTTGAVTPARTSDLYSSVWHLAGAGQHFAGMFAAMFGHNDRKEGGSCTTKEDIARELEARCTWLRCSAAGGGISDEAGKQIRYGGQR